MGAYLSEPVVEKHSSDEVGEHVSYGASSMQGWRISQEDAHNCILNFDKETCLFAVYDGHGGHEVAAYCSLHLPDYIKRTEAYQKGDYRQALEDAFLGFDSRLAQREVVDVLKQIAESKKENSFDVSEDDEDNVNSLYEEAAMPLEDVMAKYQTGMMSPQVRKLRTKATKPLSPLLRGRQTGEDDVEEPSCSVSVPGTSSGCVAVVDSEVSSSSQQGNGDVLRQRLSRTVDSNEAVSSVADRARGGRVDAPVSREVRSPEPDGSESETKPSSFDAVPDSSADAVVKTEKTDRVDGDEREANCNKSEVSRTLVELGRTENGIRDDSLSNEVSASNVSNMASATVNGDVATESGTVAKKEVDNENVSSSSSTPFAVPYENGDVFAETSVKGKGKGKGKAKISSTTASAESEGGGQNKNGHFLRQRVAQQLYNNMIDGEEEESESDDEDENFEGKEEGSDEDDEVEDGEEEDGEVGEEEEEEEDEDEDDDDEEVDEEDDSFLMKMTEEPGSDSGCTAVLALLRGSTLYVANAGDSRCVVSREGKAVEMSLDHKPEDEVETKRIVNAGGKVTGDGRVNGGLNLSRALGDHAYKQTAHLPPQEQMITALPDVRTLSVDPAKDEFMVLACDGIWNYMTSQEVVDFVGEKLAKGVDKLSKICEQLFEHCLAPNTSGDGTGCDNMTAIVVKFHSKVRGSGSKRGTREDDDDVETEAAKRHKPNEEASSEKAEAASSS